MTDRTYAIEWQRRSEPERLVCRGLTLRTLVARLMEAAKNNGGVIVHAITPELSGTHDREGEP